MNIGIDIRSLMSANRTGVGEYTYELLNSIFKIDSTNQYFLFYNSSKDVSNYIPDWKQNNVHYINTKWPNKLFNFSQIVFKYPKIDKLIIKQNNSTLQKLDYFFSPNLNFTSLSKYTKHILTIHDLSFILYPQFYSIKRRLWHKIINAKQQCQKANLILTPSENTKRDIINCFKINSNKIQTLYPGLSSLFYNHNKNISETTKKYNLPDNFILYLGTIEPRKNIINLIKAFEKAYSSMPISYSLVIAGAKGWKDKDIYKTAKNSPYKDYIKFIGYIDSQDKPTIYEMSTMFIYTSFYEGFGFPIIEAMACNTPVITSNRSSLPEITDGSAYLINPNKINELTIAINNLIDDNNLREYYIKKGQEQIKKFNWNNTATKWLKLLSL